MAGDFIIIDGTKVVFDPVFGAAIVVSKPCKIQGSGKEPLDKDGNIAVDENGKVDRKRGIYTPCIMGDEKRVKVPGVKYTVPPFVIPGIGALEIYKLGPNQIAKKLKSGGKKVILAGKQFEAVFSVKIPAKMPHPAGAPINDPIAKYQGTGRFIPANRKITGA